MRATFGRKAVLPSIDNTFHNMVLLYESNELLIKLNILVYTDVEPEAAERVDLHVGERTDETIADRALAQLHTSSKS